MLQVEALANLFARVVDVHVLKGLLPTIMEPKVLLCCMFWDAFVMLCGHGLKHLGYLKNNLGALYWFNRDNCSGYYHLNFEDKYDRQVFDTCLPVRQLLTRFVQVMRLLLAVSADEGRTRKSEGSMRIPCSLDAACDD